jgi:hypothetical protein
MDGRDGRRTCVASAGRTSVASAGKAEPWGEAVLATGFAGACLRPHFAVLISNVRFVCVGAGSRQAGGTGYGGTRLG